MDATDTSFSGTCGECSATFIASSTEQIVLLLTAHLREHWLQPLQERARVRLELLRRALISLDAMALELGAHPLSLHSDVIRREIRQELENSQ